MNVQNYTTEDHILIAISRRKYRTFLKMTNPQWSTERHLRSVKT